MLMKGSLSLCFAVIFLAYVVSECQAIQCYSCSDCNDATKSTWKNISTININDQCIKATIYTQENNSAQKLIYRGASSKCQPFTSKLNSILCCRSDFCNA